MAGGLLPRARMAPVTVPPASKPDLALPMPPQLTHSSLVPKRLLPVPMPAKMLWVQLLGRSAYTSQAGLKMGSA
jgi:hypothetical protein